MKKKLLLLLFVLTSLNFYSQVNYEKSYFIDNNGIRTECFIQNKDKNDNPTEFQYKLSLDASEIMKINIKTVKEVKIANILKYERATVKLDTSSVNLQTLNGNREPEWKEVTIFLKTLVDSEASLFEYKNGNLKRYFYKNGASPVEQLIYRKYIINEDLITKLVSNSDFQKQLWQNLNCRNQNIEELLKLKYTRKDLTTYFIEYNTCKNNVITNFDKKLEKGSVNLKGLVGFTSSSLTLNNNLSFINADFGSKMNFSFGAEFEWILPVNKNKWSLYVAPSYNSYKNSTIVTAYNRGPFLSDTVTESWDASLNHLDMSFGFRHYMFVSHNSKIFIGGSYVLSKVLDSDIHDADRTYQLEAKFSGAFGYGIGYSYKNKFNVELKRSSRNIFNNYIFFNSTYNMTSLVLGYTIFDSGKKK
jgi:hypothetical protein